MFATKRIAGLIASLAGPAHGVRAWRILAERLLSGGVAAAQARLPEHDLHAGHRAALIVPHAFYGRVPLARQKFAGPVKIQAPVRRVGMRRCTVWPPFPDEETSMIERSCRAASRLTGASPAP